MRRFVILLLATAVAVASAVAFLAPAEAATAKVRVAKSHTAHVGWSGKAVVTPRVTKAKKVRILKRSMTVYRSGVKKASGRKVSLTPGSYRAKVKVTWKYRGKTRTTTKWTRIKVSQGRCATSTNVRALKRDASFTSQVRGDSVATVATKLRSAGTVGDRSTVDARTANLSSALAIMDSADMRAETTSLITRLATLKGRGASVIEDRIYRGCGGTYSAYASFTNGELTKVEAF